MMPKDWTGNKPTAFVQMGASNHSLLKREENDFYATEPSAIDDLLSVETFSKNIWECAVGQGHLAERLKERGYKVECTDLVDRGYPNTEIVDFLKEQYSSAGDIITNPPKTVYVYSKRKNCAKNGEFEKYPSSAVCYAWFVWVKGDYNCTELRWL